MLPLPIKIHPIKIFTRATPGISLVFNKVDLTASNFEAAVGLQIEAVRKMKLATGIMTIRNCFTEKLSELIAPNAQGECHTL